MVGLSSAEFRQLVMARASAAASAAASAVSCLSAASQRRLEQLGAGCVVFVHSCAAEQLAHAQEKAAHAVPSLDSGGGGGGGGTSDAVFLPTGWGLESVVATIGPPKALRGRQLLIFLSKDLRELFGARLPRID
eukprot:COSAG01_NODE_258_length_20077_cov_124.162429_15_plen_134_part_00